jgi:hypothetical protein
VSVATRLPAFALVALVGAAGGCGGGVLSADGGGLGHVTGTGGLSGAGGAGGAGGAPGPDWGGVQNGNVDILFMIDDSSGMRVVQDTLAKSFPTMIATLKNSPQGLPNIHIAVVTSDMGAGDGSIGGCVGNGDGGRFQYAPRGACTATNLEPGATYISDVGGIRNYTGNIEDVFTCIAAVGENGCGFEQPLAAIVRALGADGRPAPAENQGFLRPEALLFVALVTNEDDCSAPAGSGLFDTIRSLNLASTLGPPANFRCNEFGHLCNGVPPPRRAPTGSTADAVSLDGCTSAEGAGMLTPVATVVQQLRALKPDPSMVMVSAIAGPRTPYVVNWDAPRTADTSCGAASCPWPVIAHSCVAADGSDADPAVRIGQWVDAFGADGRMLSACSPDYGPLLQRIGERLPAPVFNP